MKLVISFICISVLLFGGSGVIHFAPEPIFYMEEMQNEFVYMESIISVDYTETEELLKEEITKEYGDCVIYETGNLTTDILSNREGICVLERCIGIATDEQGNGRILNTDEVCNYISYQGISGIREETVVLSYLVYDPDTDGEDDIIERYDFPLELCSDGIWR